MNTSTRANNPQNTTRRFWNWVRNSDESRTLYLNGTIAEESWFDDDVTPAMFKAELLAGKGDITVWINSPGGDLSLIHI